MKRLFFILSTLVTMTACGMSEDQYIDELVEIYCNNDVDCYSAEVLEANVGYTTVDECFETYEESFHDYAPEGCEFDRDAAQECLDLMYTMTCDDWTTGNIPDCPPVYLCG